MKRNEKKIDIEDQNDKWDKDKDIHRSISIDELNIDLDLNRMNIDLNRVDKENIRHVVDLIDKHKNNFHHENISIEFDFDKTNDNEWDFLHQ